MTQVLVTKPGVLTQNDKRSLRKAGVVPVEANNPDDVRLIQTEGPALAADDLLHAAISALNGDGYRSDARAAFMKVLLVNMNEARKDLPA